MRIGLIAPPWVPVPPPAYGGTEMVVDALARGLQARGHDVLLAASADSTCSVPRVPDTAAADFGLINTTGSALTHAIRAYAAMADMDLIHDHTVVGPLYRHRPPGVPVVVTNHGPFTAEARTLFAAMADTSIVAISRDQASAAGEVPITTVIHHGMDVSGIPVGTGRGGFAVFLGRMCADKGVVEAIEVARRAGVPLRIAAKMRESSEQEFFRECVQPLLGPEQEYVGEVAGREKYELLGGAVALLNPIQWPEPFGLVMIEALATGTPVVGTPRGAAPEIVRHGVTGFLADTEDLVALLPRAGELDRAACRADVERRFSEDRMIDDHLRLYRHILRSRTPVGRLRRVAG